MRRSYVSNLCVFCKIWGGGYHSVSVCERGGVLLHVNVKTPNQIEIIWEVIVVGITCVW